MNSFKYQKVFFKNCWDKLKNNYLRFFFFFILISLFITLYSYGGIGPTLIRFIWVCASGAFILLILRLFLWPNNAIWLALIFYISAPWFVQQSVHLSDLHFFSLVILFSTYVYMRFKKIKTLIFIPLCTIFAVKLVYPSFFISNYLSFPSHQEILSTLFGIFSFESLFFRNFYINNSNPIGIFYASSLPLFIIGIYSAIQKKSMHNLCRSLFPWLILILVNDNLLGGRHSFVFIPYGAMILSLGLSAVYRYILHSGHRKFSIVMVSIYVIFFLYEFMNFFHYFHKHYLPFVIHY